MRSSLLLPIFLLLLSACNTTERIVLFEPDQLSGVQVSSNDVSALQSKYGDVDGVYLSYNETLEHNVSIAFTSTIPHWKFYRIIDRSYVVFDTGSTELNSFSLSVPSTDKLEQALLTVQVPGSSGVSYTKDDLIVQNGADGEKIYTLSYAINQPGTIIHEKVEITQGDLERNPPISHDVRLQYELPAESVNFQYVYPIWWQVDVKNLSLDQPLNYQRIEETEHRKIILAYNNQNVPAFVEEPDGPYFKQRAPYFQLQVTNLSMGSALRYRAPADWTEFARDYRQYSVSIDSRTARSIQRTTDNLVGPAASDLDRVEVILNYLKDNIILVEDSKQRSFDLVLTRREGNAYMITGLMQSMLAAANIDSEYLLIHPAYEGYFDPDFYSEDQLREPALGVFVDGEQYYVFPGRQRSLSESLPRYYAGQTAMVITEEGFGGFTEVFAGEVQGSNVIAIADNNSRNPITPVSQEGGNSVPEPVAPQPDPVVSDPPQSSGSTDQTGSTGGVTTPTVDPVQTPPVNPTSPAIEQEPEVVEPEPVVEEPQGPAWEGSIQTSLGGFTWVVASKTTLEEAHALAEEYSALYNAGISVDVLRGESKGVVRYRIAIGQYTSRQLAEEERAARLATVLPSDAWLLRIEPTM